MCAQQFYEDTTKHGFKWLKFGRYRVRISARRRDILPEVYCGLSQHYQEKWRDSILK